ncbi:MAG: DNA-directed DNA polymerase [Candidatus Aenigmarchaeota archaeon]|jgi:DNA polymerase I|nr:DNA-directed DNA polymerase [Candidatus Aenigmarchaeota archaeon]
MKVSLQVLDVDYVITNTFPTVRIFGKTKDGQSICVLYEKYLPYFYFIPIKEKEEIEKELKKEFGNLIVKMEETEKFEPTGYRKEKTKMMVIYLSDPSKVPLVRDFVVKKGLASKTFEADILFKYRFMSDFGIFGMRWYVVEGKEIKTVNIKTERTFIVEKIEEEEYQQNAPFRILSLDIETTATEGKPNPEKDKIIMISLAFNHPYQNKKTIVLTWRNVKARDVEVFLDEKSMLEELIKIIDAYDPDFIIGYNINSFDLPFLKKRLEKNKISAFLGRTKDKQLVSKRVKEDKYKNKIIGRVVVDVYEIVKEMAERGLIRLKRYSLDDVGRFFVGEGKVDIKQSEITRIWEKNGDINKLVEYSRNDALLTLRILVEKRLIEKYIELSKVCGLLLQDVLDEGEAARIESLLLREFNKRGYVLPNKPDNKEMLRRKEERETRGLKGAIVLEPKVGLYTDCYVVYLDFKSMYPTIYINFNICPTTLVVDNDEKDVIVSPYGTKFVKPEIKKGIIPQILEVLINERDKVKKEMKKEKNEEIRFILDAKQEALKRVANAFYGYTGYIRGRVYVLDIANSITSYGRYFIETSKKVVEKTNKEWEVIYGDTDSIMVKVNAKSVEEAFEIGEKIEKTLNSYYEGKLTTKIESVFKSFLIIAKKRYAGISVELEDGKFKEKMVMKGIETVRKDWCGLTEKVLSKTLELLLKDGSIEAAIDYVRRVIKDLEEGNVNIEDLIITKSLSRNIHEYKGVQPHVELVKKMMKRSPEKTPMVGDRVNFVIVAGSDLVSKRAEDPEYVLEKKLKIDTKYYIENQILPPVERIFEAVGIKKSVLFSNGKQLKLTLLSEKQNNVSNDPENFVAGDNPIIGNNEKFLEFENFMCEKCGRIYFSLPFDGRCYDCKNRIGFNFDNKIFFNIEG